MNLTNSTGVKENALREGGLAGVDVCRNTDVPLAVDPLEVCVRQFILGIAVLWYFCALQSTRSGG